MSSASAWATIEAWRGSGLRISVIRPARLARWSSVFQRAYARHADHHMGPGSPAVVVPDRPQEQLALEYSKGPFDHGQLDVGLPEFASRPAGLIAP